MPEQQERLIDEGLIPEIVEIADELKLVRDQRMDLTKRETGLAERLIAVMESHNLSVYFYEGRSVKLVTGPKKVQIKRETEDEEEEVS